MSRHQLQYAVIHNIYSWTDSRGIKHFSNVPPPPSVGSAIDVQQEIAYDRDADENRWELDQQDWEKIKQDLTEVEAQKIQENYGDETEGESLELNDKIEQEKFRLELEINRLQSLPAYSFEKGLDGKRASVAFYEARLLELKSNPERNFNMR
jgi:hypothetical protein